MEGMYHIELYLPQLFKCAELTVKETLPIREALWLLGREYGLPQGDQVLLSLLEEKRLDPSLTFCEAGIRTGDRLILII
ncbi:MAG: EsaB/YukD family protein [Lachnospiraceae bacterium]|nr:EsaB/YukD family protein [Lachnospiraceae bacterium]